MKQNLTNSKSSTSEEIYTIAEPKFRELDLVKYGNEILKILSNDRSGTAVVNSVTTERRYYVVYNVIRGYTASVDCNELDGVGQLIGLSLEERRFGSMNNYWQEVLKVLKTERECVRRNEETDCGRKCSECDLALETQEVLNAYNSVIDLIEDLSKQFD